MPHDDHVYVVVDHLDGVFQCLALALTGVGGIRESDDFRTKTIDCSLETEPGPGGGFKEKARYHLAFQEVLDSVLLELLGCFQNMQDFFLAEIPNRNQTFVVHIANVVPIILLCGSLPRLPSFPGKCRQAKAARLCPCCTPCRTSGSSAPAPCP